jgi:two-component system, OmpR family, KDP operon response regulator KdpE
MVKVLVIDDDPSLLKALRLGLKAGGHQVVTATNGEDGLTQAALLAPDIVVLDLGLPDVNGLTVSQNLREWSHVPIIILSAAGAEDTKIAALNGGADDYVTKPFDMGELEARIRAVMRGRRRPADDDSPAQVSVGDLDLDFVHHEAHLGGRRIELTTKEFNVLGYLARHAGRTCTHQMILNAVWGPGYGNEASYVHAYVHRLRHKLRDEDGTLIETAPGIGYSFNPAGGRHAE